MTETNVLEHPPRTGRPPHPLRDETARKIAETPPGKRLEEVKRYAKALDVDPRTIYAWYRRYRQEQVTGGE